MAIDLELSSTSQGALMRATRELSAHYRNPHQRATSTLFRSDADVRAYLAYRFPATFAAIGAVLAEVQDRRPDFRPSTLLDVGAGPGTASWAALQLWPDVSRLVMLERDAGMRSLGHALASGLQAVTWREIFWVHGISLPESLREQDKLDLVVAAYVLGEQLPEERAEFARRLWIGTRDVCVIIEPGTPCGSQNIRSALEELAKLGAHIIAPFPAEWHCLEDESDWCHFSQRVPRTRLHRLVKDGELSHEDEKFAYVVASRSPGAPIAGRVIRHPQIRGGHIRLTLCTAGGVQHVVVTRSQREAYRKAKDLQWGSAIEVEDAELFGI